ncbi:MAG: glutamyl-tRNA reductase [Prevotellaceae bacterium]|jgi:glutamyl-tRNA reductase|nr:glutamyl-tRNA reductase [Prevotellaceae bacterium]
MINCKLINNSRYNLEEREFAAKDVLIDEDTPHVLLNTCNRVELYWGEGEVSADVIRHLYRVASGLESSLVGERAIQGQIKTAYAAAQGRYRMSATLNRLFQSAMHTGKRIRNETRISEGAVSHSQITVDLLRAENIDLKEKVVSIIGVNKLTEDIMKYLVSHGAANIFLSNRSIDKAKAMAAKYGGKTIGLAHKRRMLSSTDVLICASSAPHTLIEVDDLEVKRKILIFDLAFPRDVDKSVRRIETVKLFDLDDVESFARTNLSLRAKEISKAESIIEEEIAKFYSWYSLAQ